MAEFEELRLTVNLVDNASAGLAKLNEQIRQLGGGQMSAGLDRFRREGAEVNKMLGGLGETAVGTTGRVTMLARGLGIAGGAITALGLAAKAEYDNVNRFTAEMARLNTTANLTGQNAAQIKLMTDAMQRSGISNQDATRTIHGLSEAMADFGRVNSRIRQELMRGNMTTQQRADLQEFSNQLRKLASSNDIAGFANTVKDALDNVYKIGIEQGLSPARAAEARRRLAAMFGGDALIEMQAKFERASEADKARMAQRITASKEYNTILSSIGQSWSKINDDSAASWVTNTRLLEVLRQVDPIAKAIAASYSTWSDKLSRGLIQGALQGAMGLPGGSALLPLAFPGLLRPFKPGTAGQSATPPPGGSVGGGGGTDWGSTSAYPFAPPGSMDAYLAGHPESTNVEDRRGETKDKYIQENTSELKRLNDYLTGVTTGGIGGGAINVPQKLLGGGGIPGTSAGTGGGGFGGGGGGGGSGGGDLGAALGLGDIGGGGSGATPPGTPAMPNGSQVGPGTGPGAGATPAGPASGGGGGGGGGTGGPGAAGLRGEAAQNAQRMYTTLRGLGHSHQQASAALAHARAESSFNPNTSGDRGTAHGFFQMRGERWANAQRMAREQGLDPKSPEAAAQFLDHELRNDPANAGRGTGAAYFGAQTTREAVTALNKYERFKGWQQGQPQRYQYGEQFAATMGGGAGGGAGAGGAAAAPTQGGGDREAPAGVIAQARRIASLGPGAVSEYMRKAGYPKHDQWCGDFAATAVSKAGGTPPKDWQVASNWRNVGPEVSAENAQPGDVAVARPGWSRRGSGRTGQVGSHVTIFGGQGERGRFEGVGGNQGAFSRQFNTRQFQFYRPQIAGGEQPDRGSLDTAMGNEVNHNVHGTGQIDVNVRAPRNTRVNATSGGLFKRVAMHRQQQMEPAASGAPEPTAAMEE